MEVVINRKYGGFEISKEAEDLYKSYTGVSFSLFDFPRNDPTLIRVVKELGERANGNYSKLKIIEIPLDVDWEIQDYDGIEWVAEKHRTWS
jgi:hypothetical protein